MAELYAWGNGRHGQIGSGEMYNEYNPRLVEELQGVAFVDIQCGSDYTVVTTTSDKVYAWGCGWGGWPSPLWGCGWSCVGGDQLKPRLLTSVEKLKVRNIGCGSSHSSADVQNHGYSHLAVVSEEGQLYTWGWGAYGQLGVNDNQDYGVPQLVRGFDDMHVMQVACGGAHTLALTETGHVFSWGCGWNGRLGHGDTKDHFKPRVIDSFVKTRTRIKYIDVGFCRGMTNCEGLSHCAAITAHGELYMWGWGLCGQLGTGDRYDLYTPTVVEELAGKYIVQVACGATHTLALTESGSVYSWGWGQYGQLGHGIRQEYFTPKIIQFFKGKKVVYIAAGQYHSAAVTKHGELYTWGWGECGQLGHGTPEDELTPRLVTDLKTKHLVKVVCGASHTVAVTDEYVMDAKLTTNYWQDEEAVQFHRESRAFVSPRRERKPMQHKLKNPMIFERSRKGRRSKSRGKSKSPSRSPHRSPHRRR